MTAVLIIMTAFASCKKDKDSKNDDPGGGGGGGGALAINATVVDGNDYNGYIATVKAMMEDDYDDYAIASGKYANGGFKLNLPESVPARYLYSFDYIFEEDFEGTISDRKAKTGDVWIVAYDREDDEIGEFLWTNENEDVWAYYVYVDRNLTIKGHESWYYSYENEYYYTEYDCSFTKGWNILYYVEKGYYEELFTTKKPSGTTLKWYYEDWDWWKKSPSDRQHPFSKMRKVTVN